MGLRDSGVDRAHLGRWMSEKHVATRYVTTALGHMSGDVAVAVLSKARIPL